MTAVLYAHTRPAVPISPEILRHCINAPRELLPSGTPVRFLTGGREVRGRTLFGARIGSDELYAVAQLDAPAGDVHRVCRLSEMILEGDEAR